MAAYVALLADQFESLSYPLAPWIQRPPSTFSYEQSCRRIGWAALEHEGILVGYRIKQAVGAWRSRMGRKVLVVDDEPLVLDVVATMLEELGCDVETAHTGADALNRLGSEEHIDILLADINMPGLDGRKLAYRAKQMRPELNVLLLSGRENDGYGFPIIRKPFLESDLKRVMSQTTGLC